MSDVPARHMGFQITLPVRSAREARVMTSLAELFLWYGSPDRDYRQAVDYRCEEARPLANALDYLLIALHENVLLNFQDHFFDYWEGESDTRAWSTVVADLRQAAHRLEQEIRDITQRWQETEQPDQHVSVETSHGGEV